MEDRFSLGKLKEEYTKLREKYGLPEFSDMNRVFDIEEIDFESDFLLRKIRRVVSEKISGYLRFIEIIINPSNAPMFIFRMLKKINEEDKKQLSEIYETLGGFELEIIKLDLSYNELEEAEFVKRMYSILSGEISQNLLNILKKMSNSDKGKEEKDRVSYFG